VLPDEAAAATRYEQDDLHLVYAGTWRTNSSAPLASGGSFRYANSAGASLTVRFTGTSFSWIAKKSPVYGKARVTLDGTSTVVDLYNSKELWQQTVWQKTGLTDTSHTVKIEWTGTKNTAATDYNIGVDAFLITGTIEDIGSVAPAAPRAPFATVYGDRTRVTFDLPTSPSTVTAAISSDGVLTVDYTGIPLAGPVTLAVGSPEVHSVTAVQRSSGPVTVRISIDLARYRGFRVMSLAPSDGYPHRVVIDVYQRTAGPEGDGPPLVCVDAGHGGFDSGAIGASGAYEKTLNLNVSLLVAENLRSRGLRVMMTRDTDVYVPLNDRADMANAADATLFLSIHNNASTDPTANGTQTFYKGTPASYSAEGRLYAQALQRQLVAALGFRDRGATTHWYNLVVLNRPVMTTALVELGFVTNPVEEAKLLNPAVQQAAAWALTNGILEYLQWSTKVYTTEESSPDDFTSPVSYTFLRGTDRYDTAIRLSKAVFPTALPAGAGLVVAPGETFPEALCAAPLAAAWGGPVLLTYQAALANNVKAELQRLGPSQVFCVGLSAGAVAEVRAALPACTVTALAGADVYALSREVALALEAKVGDLSGATAIITRGDMFPDAIGVAPLACAKLWPILLTNGPAGALHPSSVTALGELGITTALKVGTYATLPAQITSGSNLSGADRYATNRNVARWARINAGLSFAHTAIATGDKFPDALASGPYLALTQGILLLSPLRGPLPAVISAELAANAGAVQRLSFIACIEPVISQVQALLP
jgi:N-acetylmuramoyl-L-alanine amidase